MGRLQFSYYSPIVPYGSMILKISFFFGCSLKFIYSSTPKPGFGGPSSFTEKIQESPSTPPASTDPFSVPNPVYNREGSTPHRRPVLCYPTIIGQRRTRPRPFYLISSPMVKGPPLVSVLVFPEKSIFTFIRSSTPGG